MDFNGSTNSNTSFLSTASVKSVSFSERVTVYTYAFHLNGPCEHAVFGDGTWCTQCGASCLAPSPAQVAAAQAAAAAAAHQQQQQQQQQQQPTHAPALPPAAAAGPAAGPCYVDYADESEEDASVAVDSHSEEEDEAAWAAWAAAAAEGRACNGGAAAAAEDVAFAAGAPCAVPSPALRKRAKARAVKLFKKLGAGAASLVRL